LYICTCLVSIHDVLGYQPHLGPLGPLDCYGSLLTTYVTRWIRCGMLSLCFVVFDVVVSWVSSSDLHEYKCIHSIDEGFFYHACVVCV
jgi:hypothetical protein